MAEDHDKEEKVYTNNEYLRIIATEIEHICASVGKLVQALLPTVEVKDNTVTMTPPAVTPPVVRPMPPQVRAQAVAAIEEDPDAQGEGPTPYQQGVIKMAQQMGYDYLFHKGQLVVDQHVLDAVKEKELGNTIGS